MTDQRPSDASKLSNGEFTNTEVVERLKWAGRRAARRANGRHRDDDPALISIPVHTDNIDVICIYGANRLEALAAERDRLRGLLERAKVVVGFAYEPATAHTVTRNAGTKALLDDIKAALADDDGGGG